MSIRTAAYVRMLLDPRDDEGNPVEPSPSIAALSATARHLCEVLSNIADANGEWSPSIETLARRMRRGERVVQRARGELVAAGVLTVDLGGGRGHASTYRFPVVNPLSTTVSPTTPFIAERVSSTTRKGVAHDTRSIHEGVLVTSRDAVSRGAALDGEDSLTPVEERDALEELTRRFPGAVTAWARARAAQ